MAHLELTGIHKSFPTFGAVLNGIELAVERGEIVSLLGPSGCGKSTLLRVVAGLERPDRGSVLFEGHDLAGVPAHRRRFGLMFQEFALFPHMTVVDNVAFGLRMAGQSRAEARAEAARLLELVDLVGFDERAVDALSGGERQRVALARSLAPSPRLLMLDEPLGNLDRALREELMTELRAILKRLGLTALYVTHDQREAYAVADRVAVMRQGRVEQIGTPERVYRKPASVFVARFLGLTNLLPATVAATDAKAAQTPIGVLRLAEAAAPGRYTILVRPRAAAIDNVASGRVGSGIGTRVTGTVCVRSFRGSRYRVAIEVPGADGTIRLDFELPAGRQASGTAPPEIGQPLAVTLDPEGIVLLADAGLP